MNDRWLSVDEISEYLGVSKETIYRWLDKKKIPSHRVGKFWRFKTSEVDNWIINGSAASEAVDNRKVELVSEANI